MSSTMTPPTATLGHEGELCASCGQPLAVDQRYCLECGERRGDARVPFALAGGPAPPTAPDRPDATPPRGPRGGEWSPLAAIGLVAMIALVLVAGVLIGRGGDEDGAQVAAVGTGGSTENAGSSEGGGSFESDWPSGKDGFTVELGTLAKDGTSASDVTAAKNDVAAKGAPKVGALDSDEFGSLPGGNYIIYSGVYETKDAASKALKKLTGDFPDARVVKVSADAPSGGGGAATDTGAGSAGTVGKGELENLENLSGDDYVKESKKLPDETATQGKAPPKDNKAPGGGTGAVEF